MRIIPIVISILFSTYSSISQELLPIELDTTDRSQRIALQGNAFYLSSGIQNGVAKRIVFGGEIDEEVKSQSLESHDELNRLGADVRIRMQYFSEKNIIANNSRLSWMVDAGFESHLAAQYSKETFGLLFFGNDYYRGETVNLSNSFGQLQSFYTIGGGIHDLKTKSFVSLNAILPTNDIRFSVDKGNLYTSNNADTLNLLLDGSASQSISPAFFQGIGAAVNFDVNIPVSTHSGLTGFMSIKGRNIGAYYLNRTEKISASANTSITGYSIEDVISLTEEEGNVLNDSLNVNRDTLSQWRLAPGFIQVGKVVERYTDKQLQAFFGVRMYTNSVYRPLGYIGAHWSPALAWSAGAQVSFGGYGNFRGGFYAGYSADRFSLSIGTEDIIGLLAESQYGQSALMRMSWKL